MDIRFLGAADAVTGSRHLVALGGSQILLDCGLFQGFKTLRERNWAPFPVPPASIDAVVLSHAHLDHSGYLPALVKQGFKGPIWCSPATQDLAAVLLLDSAHLQEEDARRANRGGYSKHAKALPLYTVADAKRAIAHFKPVVPGRCVRIGSVQMTLHPAGHLLGACSVSLHCGGQTLLYSGDLGRQHDLLMPPPERVPQADILLVESTYGNRLHPQEAVESTLGALVRDTFRHGGSVLMPSFAVGRAQALLLLLQRLKQNGEILADIKIYLDSPMAIEATALYKKHRKSLRLTSREVATLTDGVVMVAKAAASQQLSLERWPSIIIAASGMATGGRVLHHIKTLAPQPRNHIVFPGFQVQGTRGAKMLAGEKTVKIHGEYVAVKAQVSHLSSLSGHADANELMAWLRGIETTPRDVFVVHGEPVAADTLRGRIQDELGWRARVPEQGAHVTV